MPSTLDSSKEERDNLVIPFLSAFLITMFLFFIDEGYYDFRWMREWGNWIVFVIYLFLLFPLQWLLARFLLGKFRSWTKALMMLLIGIPLTLVLFYLLIMK